jgi:hypothetical protein
LLFYSFDFNFSHFGDFVGDIVSYNHFQAQNFLYMSIIRRLTTIHVELIQLFVICSYCVKYAHLLKVLIGNVLCFAGKTYRFRVHNVGTSTSLNFRIQGHNLLLVETEGHYTVQQNFSSFDIHVGQSCSFLVTMDQNATSDYYIVASARFVNESLWQKVTGVGILQYSNSKGSATGPLPEAPSDIYNQWSAMNQPKAIRLVL